MQIPAWMLTSLELLTGLFVLVIGLAVLIIPVLYVVDRTQKASAVRRNFPVIGRFRFLFEHLGEFFRQYFFAMDREEMPFNRAQRSWAYRAAKDVDNTSAFGSTRDLRPPGSVIFVNCPFPTLGEDAVTPEPVIMGPSAREPYTTSSLVNVSAMSFGALSKPAVRALSKGAKKAGIWVNTGEGGLAPHHLEGGCDVVFQIGTAKYGVRDADGGLDEDKLRAVASHDKVKMIELKLAQGAKPGKGGILPAAKVTEEIAKIRGIPVGVDSISPNRHPEIGSVDELLDFVARLREVSGLPTGIKTVIGGYGWLDELMLEIKHRGFESAPDFITVDGGDGGTGAAPMPLMDDVGLPLREALPLVVDALIRHGLRERIKVISSGKRISPTEVAHALAMGADFVNIARGFMFALGCIQSFQCNKNTCPTGVTTHDVDLQKGLVVSDKAERVANYAKNMVKEVGIIAHSCGVHEPRLLRRKHARVVTQNGLSVSLEELHPEPQPIEVDQ
jgi:glutamate synthase domain-containing protein 2